MAKHRSSLTSLAAAVRRYLGFTGGASGESSTTPSSPTAPTAAAAVTDEGDVGWTYSNPKWEWVVAKGKTNKKDTKR